MQRHPDQRQNDRPTAVDSQRWRPNVTVAAVVPRGDRFLIVEERDRVSQQRVLNQPAGHLEPAEGLIEAVRREVLEETRWQVEVTGYLGVARYEATNGTTYLRHSFVALPEREISSRQLDDGIIASLWLTRDAIEGRASELRSPLVLADIDRYALGKIAPLDFILDIPL